MEQQKDMKMNGFLLGNVIKMNENMIIKRANKGSVKDVQLNRKNIF